MIIKEIRHNNMTASVNYLYKKAQNDPKNTGQYAKHGLQPSKEEFLDGVKRLVKMREDLTHRKSTVNNQIKHFVLGCHPEDRSAFEARRDEILQRFFKKLDIAPENHLANVFIHNDSTQPHMHVIFSRIGEDLSVVHTAKIGGQMSFLARDLSREFGFIFQKEVPTITFTNKDLRRPSDRTDLLKLIDHAIKDANTLEDYFTILKRHGVVKREVRGKLIYFTPNPNLIPLDQLDEKISEARRNTKSREEYQKALKEIGLSVRWDKDGKEIQKILRYKGWKEDRLPRAARLAFLEQTIRSSNLNPALVEGREILKRGIESCKTLGDIQQLLPEYKMRYQIMGNRVENITFEYENQIIRLHEAFVFDVQTQPYERTNPMNIPIIFTPRIHDRQDEILQEFMRKKYGKKHKQIGFKRQV